MREVLSAQLKISDIGRARGADETKIQTPTFGCARFYNVSTCPNIMFVSIK
jgi:hypothetical protein